MPANAKSISRKRAAARANPESARARSNEEEGGNDRPSSMREEVAALRKDLIVRAASDAFFEHGYHDCTVDMIAERLSGTKAIVYYYFSDKHSILEEIYRRALEAAHELIMRAVDEGGDPRAKLAMFARLYAGWVVDNQRTVGIFWREERCLTEKARAMVALGQKKMDDLVALIIREGVAKGQFKVDDVQTTARAISGMISFTYTWWRADRRMSRDAAADYYAEMALRMAGATAA